MIQAHISGLIIAGIAAILMISTAVSCAFITKAVNKTSTADAIHGWCTFAVIALALFGAFFGALTIFYL